MAFFAIIVAFSSPDSAKLEKLKQETSKSMKVEYKNPFEDLARKLIQILKELNLADQVEITKLDDGIQLLSRGTLFFDSGSASLKPIAQMLMSKLAEVLTEEAKGYRVVVEGHTDDNRVLSKKFASNWELSSSRASTVVRLLESKGFERSFLSPIGLADTRPLVPNRDAQGEPLVENQARNRRIIIRILKTLPGRLKFD